MWLLADLWQLEFGGQVAFAWWALVVGAAGVGLIAYAIMLLREAAAGKRGTEPELGRKAAWHATPAGGGALQVRGMPVAAVSLGMGIASLAVTLCLLVFKTPPHGLVLGWTAGMVAGTIWLFYLRVYRYLSKARMAVLLGLRVGGMLALVVLLFEPVLGFIKSPEARAKLAVVVDASGSMGVNDQPNEPNRYRQSALAVQNVLLPRLAGQYEIQVYAYDGKHPQPLAQAEELDGIPPNGTATDLVAAVGLGTSGGASAGGGQVVLFSDGIHNGAASVAVGLTKAAISTPVHTVRVGSSSVEPSTVPDIAVLNVDGPPTVTVNNLVTLTASIKSTALSDRTVKVQLKGVRGQGLGVSDEVFEEQRLVLRSGPTPQSVQLKFTPDKVGRVVVRVAVPVDPGERNEANNQQDFPLLVTDPKLAVLYVEGRVRPEVGPLRRALEQDPNINAISMVQTQAGKFELRGVKQGDDLKGMPTTLAQWKRFKVIILGDLDSSFLNGQQQRDLQQAVKEGTGLLMIGGQNSFAPGGWDKTVLGDLLPVGLSKTEPAQLNEKFVPQLTAAGAAHPIFRNIAGYFVAPDGKAAAQMMPDLSGCVALASAKGGANVLAVDPKEKIGGAPAIVLAVEQYAQGRTAAFAADTTWRWSLFLKGQGKDSPYNRFWGQMVRWLAGQEDLAKKSGPSVTAMIPKERYESGEPVVLRCAVTDHEGQSTAFATVWADLIGPDGKKGHVGMTAVPEQIGVYEGTYQPQVAGGFEVVLGASKDNKTLGSDKSTFSVTQAAGELEVLAAQPLTLEEISRLTGGDHVEISGVAALVERLAAKSETVATAQHGGAIPLYSTRGFFLLFIAALTAEWFLRRKWQLQ